MRTTTPARTRPDIRITAEDRDRIEALLERLGHKRALPTMRFLEAEVSRAVVIDDEVSQPPFVRLGSRVVFGDDSGRVHSGVLSLPGAGGASALSIASTIGTALLGLSPGQIMTYETPDGSLRSVRVLRVA